MLVALTFDTGVFGFVTERDDASTLPRIVLDDGTGDVVEGGVEMAFDLDVEGVKVDMDDGTGLVLLRHWVGEGEWQA